MDYIQLHQRKDYDEVRKLALYRYFEPRYRKAGYSDKQIFQFLDLNSESLQRLHKKYETDQDFREAVDLCQKKY